MTSRRSLLGGAAGLAVGAGIAAVAPSSTTRADGAGSLAVGDVVKFGTAALSAAITAFARSDTHGYVVTRGQNPPKLVEFEIDSLEVTRVVALADGGEGGWACAVSPTTGKVYAATYSTARVYEFDPATGAVKMLGTVGPFGTIVFTATAGPDGMIYFGTYSRGEAWRYDPSTETFTNFGRVNATTQYARNLAATTDHLFVSTIPGSIVRIDVATRTKTTIHPVGDPDVTSIGAMLVLGEKLVLGTSTGIVEMNFDGSDKRKWVGPTDTYLIDGLWPAGDGLVAVDRQTGNVWQGTAEEMTLVAGTSPGDENRGITVRDDGSVVVAQGSGLLSYGPLDGGMLTGVDLAETDAAGPESLQSLALGPGASVAVGGHFALTVHQPLDGTSRRFHVAGEAKDMVRWEEEMIVGLYPLGSMIAVHAETGEQRNFGRLGHGQQRPWRVVRDQRRDRILMVSAPSYGNLTGALTILDPRSGAMEVRTDILVDQALTDIHVAGDLAYIAGDTWGGNGTKPTQPTSQVAVVDLTTDQVIDRFAPIPAAPSIAGLTVQDGLLYCLYKRAPSGTWTVWDLARRSLVATGTKLTGYGFLTAHRGHVLAGANFGDNLYELGPDGVATTLYPLIGTNWYTIPRIIAVPGRAEGWTAIDRELARIGLPR